VQIRAIMTEAPTCVSPGTGVVEGAELMRDHDVGCLPVCDGDRLVGILTDRDIVLRHVARRVAETVDAIMTPFPYCVGPDDPIERARALMVEHGVRRLPVCVGRDLIGIVSASDLARKAVVEA